jgi:hypothetical protein
MAWTPLLRGFAQAAAEITEKQVWALGWSTEDPADLRSSNNAGAG